MDAMDRLRTHALVLIALMLSASLAVADEPAPVDDDVTSADLLAIDPTHEIFVAPPVEPLPWDLRPGAIPVGESPFTWSALHYALRNGNHDLTVTSGMAYYEDDWGFGSGLATGSMGGSITYRYYGILDGAIRPVARLSVSGSQGWDTGSMSNAGLAGMWTGYAFAEAGMEFVYNGYGVGVTAGYVLPMNAVFPSEGDKYTTGPWSPRYEEFDWKKLIGNVYLIAE